MPANQEIRVRLDEFDRLTSARGWDTDSVRARQIGVSASTLTRLRAGECQPSAVFIHRALTALQTSYPSLFESVKPKATV